MSPKRTMTDTTRGAARRTSGAWRIGGLATALLVVAAIVVALAIPIHDANANADQASATSAPGQLCAHCVTPQVVRDAYDVTPLLHRGVDGRGYTVVFPEAPIPVSRSVGEVSLSRSLAAFDRRFGLPAARLRVDTTLAPGSSPGALGSTETLQDVEVTHAIAPGAKLVVELVAGRGLQSRLPAVIDEGARDGNVISISYLAPENMLRSQVKGIQAALSAADRRGVSVVSIAGDFLDMAPEDVRGLNLPGSDPLVTTVGGTELRVSHDGRYEGETFWNAPQGRLDAVGGGGGFSDVFARPAYQDGVPGIGSHRGDPDVAFEASSINSMESVKVSTGHCSPHCVDTFAAAGTSEGAPAWAGIAALADQEAGHPLGLLNPALYRIGRSARYHAAFHDITTGDNSATTFTGRRIPGYRATKGWDPITGWGTPKVAALVPLLAHGG